MHRPVANFFWLRIRPGAVRRPIGQWRGMASSRSRRLRPKSSTGRALAVTALFAAGLAGCGGGSGGASPPRPLVVGMRRATPPRSAFRAGVRVARNFVRIYARQAYRRIPPRPNSTDRRVIAALAAAAARVPFSRRGLQPRLSALAIQPVGLRSLRATARIVDGHSPPFSVAFTLHRGPRGWQVIAISLPG